LLAQTPKLPLYTQNTHSKLNLQGISYLVVLGLIGWSITTKVSTGSGLPAGPTGLLGAAEGVSYLTLLAGIVAFGAKFVS
jgi:hypothetical protein